MIAKRWICRVVAVLGVVWTVLGRGLSVIVWSWRITRRRVGQPLRTRRRICPRIGPFGEIISPVTLSVLERVCRLKKIRFFGCGEYGERGGRPHYHAILYGVDGSEASIRKSWSFGHVGVHQLTPAAIKYVAGYCSKKEGCMPSIVRYLTGRVVSCMVGKRLFC